MRDDIRAGAKGKRREDDGAGFDVRPLLVTALALHEERGGVWGKPTPKAPFGSIRNARCFVCDEPEMSVTPTGDGGVVACCNGCGARKWPMFNAAEKAGVRLSAPRSVKRKLSGQERAELQVAIFFDEQPPITRRHQGRLLARTVTCSCVLQPRPLRSVAASTAGHERETLSRSSRTHARTLWLFTYPKKVRSSGQAISRKPKLSS
jgi:hypothetical protein